VNPIAKCLRSTVARAALLALGVIGAAQFSTPAVAGESPAPGKGSSSKPRNIIFVIVDDLRFDGLGFLQPRIKTPHIDRMAREGSYFPNAVVTSALCSPSRATILTGQTARNHRVVDNNSSSEAGLTFFPGQLQQAGYQTAFVGKWHMGNDTDSPRPGFDKWISFRGQGAYYPTSGIPAAAKARGAVNMLNVDGRAVPQRGYITDELTDYAIDWLDKGRDRSKPFFLYLSHKALHSDPLPPLRHARQYDGVDFPLPASAADTPEHRRNKPMWVQNQRNSWHGIDFFYNSSMPMAEYLRYYYATLSGVDDSMGRVMAWLRRHKLDRDTLVVFTSDNGYMIGEHGLIDKRNAYQASVRVPLIVWQPGTVAPGTVNQGRVRNLDFAPTFLDAAGVAAPGHYEGQSAWSLFNGRIGPAIWTPQDFIYEYYWEYNFPMTPGTFAIERGGIKYIQYYGVYDTDELYDLNRDPDELRNLINDPAYSDHKVTLRRALFDQLADRNGDHLIPFGMRQSIGSVRRKRGGSGAADFPDNWLVEPDRPDRFDDLIPDGPQKRRAQEKGEPLFHSNPLRDQLEEQVREP
jgi:arylsulfatase A-like enzyme